VSLNGLTSANESTVIVENSQVFFPNISVQTFIEIYRLPNEYNEKIFSSELKNAMYQVNDKLTDFVLILQSVVVAETLETFDSDLIDVYKSAVMHYARNGLMKHFETLNTKKAADIQAERAEAIRTPWIADANNLIDIISKGIMDVAEGGGALPKSGSASGFRASLI